ncbi:MAG: DinB family protein [Weeksellaceae bacterium]|nr:DinB family protein [Weeksellaceae bacterium]
MKKHFEDLSIIRQHFIRYLEDYDLKHLTHIPMGFKNHIFWNCAHALVTQQLLIYHLSGNNLLIDNDWVFRFKKGTFGEQNINENDVTKLTELLSETVSQTRIDYFAERFSNYQTYQTSFGIRLKTVEDAIRFNNIHEGLHIGYIMSMKKHFD